MQTLYRPRRRQIAEGFIMGLSANAVVAADTAGSEKRAKLQAVRNARRNGNKIRRLHHHAVRTDDMEATWRFYEDVLGMPMVAALKESLDKAPIARCLSCIASSRWATAAACPSSSFSRTRTDPRIGRTKAESMITSPCRFPTLCAGHAG